MRALLLLLVCLCAGRLVLADPSDCDGGGFATIEFYANTYGNALTCAGSPISLLYYPSGACTPNPTQGTSTRLHIDRGCGITLTTYGGLNCHGLPIAVATQTIQEFFGLPNSVPTNICYGGFKVTCKDIEPSVVTVSSVEIEYFNNDHCQPNNGGRIRVFVDPSNLCSYNAYFNLSFIDINTPHQITEIAFYTGAQLGLCTQTGANATFTIFSPSNPGHYGLCQPIGPFAGFAPGARTYKATFHA
eukprot:RCo046621